MTKAIKKNRVPAAEAERNKQVYQDYLSGMSSAELIAKYGFSNTRLYFIINREKKRAEATK